MLESVVERACFLRLKRSSFIVEKDKHWRENEALSIGWCIGAVNVAYTDEDRASAAWVAKLYAAYSAERKAVIQHRVDRSKPMLFVSIGICDMLIPFLLPLVLIFLGCAETYVVDWWFAASMSAISICALFYAAFFISKRAITRRLDKTHVTALKHRLEALEVAIAHREYTSL